MADKKEIKLTDCQRLVLESLETKRFAFPGGRLVRTCEKLERLGLAESTLGKVALDRSKGIVTFRRAYRRTKAGTKVANTIT